MTGTLGLRERKKLGTRWALSDAALELALERGLENVTREDIANRAGVSLRTFNNYFTGKYEAVAFRQVDREKLILVRALGATKWQQFRKVVFPFAIPAIVATLKVNIGLSLIGTIVGEFLAASAGVGSLIVYGQNVFDMSLVMTCLVLLTAIAGVMYYAIVLAERHFVRWQRD